MKEKLHTHEYDIKNIIKQQHNIIYLKPLQPKYIPKYTYISSYNTMSSLSSYEQKMMRERMIKKIKNETMGDVMFQHLKDSFGDDLKVKDPDEDISQSSQKKNKKKKKGGKQSDITSIDPSNLKNLKENKNNNIKMIQPSTGNNNNNNNNNNANKPVATYTTKDGKKGTLTAAEYIKLQKAYQKYKIENTPRSFNKNATPGTDYNKWDKFVKELDKEEEGASCSQVFFPRKIIQNHGILYHLQSSLYHGIHMTSQFLMVLMAEKSDLHTMRHKTSEH